MSIPKRGFAVSEYERRLENIQKLMFESKMDAILLTTHVSKIASIFDSNISF